MNRRLGVVAALVLAVLPASAARSVSSLTYTMAVTCADPDGTDSSERLGVTMPAGWYTVAISGACVFSASLTDCVSTGWVTLAGCDGTGGTLACPNYYFVMVDGQCPSYGGGGLVYHDNSGPMTARFDDCPWCYADNTGNFLVTVTWTPL